MREGLRALFLNKLKEIVIMTKGLIRSQKRGPALRQQVHKMTIPVNAVAISVVGASGIGFGGVALRGLPEANILILGAVSNMQFTAGANTIATWTGSFGIGSTLNAAGATLTGTTQDIVPSATLAAATASVSPVTRSPQPTQSIVDNTDNSKAVYLNLLIDDASISGTTPVTASGWVTLLYSTLGDD
jgi:hypothetical protein